MKQNVGEKRTIFQVYQTTFQGLMGTMTGQFAWLTFWVILIILCRKAYATKGFGLINFAELDRIDSNAITFFGTVFLAILGIVATIAVLVMIAALIRSAYQSRTVNYIYAGKIVEKNFSFPFKMNTVEIKFDRIISVDIEQDSINRLNNTGSLRLGLLTYANADTIETDWWISFINDPHSAKDKILADLPGYTGVSVKLI